MNETTAGKEDLSGFLILYCTADLMLGSPIHSTAEALGFVAQSVRTLEKLQSKLSAHQGPMAFVVDLDAGPIAIQLLQAISSANVSRPVETIAFGPHVNEQTFRDARKAGADRTMPRGQFVAHLPAILEELARGKFSQAHPHPLADDEKR